MLAPCRCLSFILSLWSHLLHLPEIFHKLWVANDLCLILRLQWIYFLVSISLSVQLNLLGNRVKIDSVHYLQLQDTWHLNGIRSNISNEWSLIIWMRTSLCFYQGNNTCIVLIITFAYSIVMNAFSNILYLSLNCIIRASLSQGWVFLVCFTKLHWMTYWKPHSSRDNIQFLILISLRFTSLFLLVVGCF